jgi:ribosome-associated toxin RatA of RatAB toxin-antitoxin module
MEKIGVGSFFLQTIYTSHYVSNRAKGTVAWTPVQDGGNANVSGSWTIADNKKSTKIELRIEAELSLPVPAMMKALVQPMVTSEFETLTEKYIDNLVKRFGGEA